VIADVAAALARAQAFTLRCGELAPELQVAAQGLAGRQQHLHDTTRRAVLRRSAGSTWGSPAVITRALSRFLGEPCTWCGRPPRTLSGLTPSSTPATNRRARSTTTDHEQAHDRPRVSGPATAIPSWVACPLSQPEATAGTHTLPEVRAARRLPAAHLKRVNWTTRKGPRRMTSAGLRAAPARPRHRPDGCLRRSGHMHDQNYDI
jgi:hypothetical protein